MLVHPEFERLTNTHGWVLEDHAIRDAADELWISNMFSPVETAFGQSTSQLIDSLADNSWWFRTRNEIITRLCNEHLNNSVLWDIGCGTGVVGAGLAPAVKGVIGIEPSVASARASARRGLTVVCGTLASLGLPSESIQLAGLFDVLEHIHDRREFLLELRRVMASESRLLITLPAVQFLWSSVDVEAGHHLRYSKHSIESELNEVGFAVDWSGYFFSLAILPLILTRVIPDRLRLNRRGFSTARADTSLLARNFGLFGNLLRRFELSIAGKTPVGNSLLVIAKPK